MKSSLIRNFTFGVEDSLASTVGLLSGVAAAQSSKSTVIITGLILIVVEALSMAVGSLLSEQSVVESRRHVRVPLASSLPGAVTMFISYLIAGLIPILPYVFLPVSYGLYVSVGASLIGLSSLGYINAKIARVSPVVSVFRMLVLGGSVTVAGVLIGSLLKV